MTLNGKRKPNTTLTGILPELSPELKAAGKAYQGCVGAGEQYCEQSRRDLEPLMLEFGVDLYIAGHMHAYEYVRFDCDYDRVYRARHPR